VNPTMLIHDCSVVLGIQRSMPTLSPAIHCCEAELCSTSFGQAVDRVALDEERPTIDF